MLAKRGIWVVTVAGATSVIGWGGSMTMRVSLTWKGVSAGPAGDLGALAARHVVALDREHLLVRILRILEDVAGRGVAAEEDRAAVGGESGLAQFLLILRVGPLDQRHAVADAGDMVEPDL